MSTLVALAQLLIDKEVQFNRLKVKFADYAGCASSVDLRQIKNNLIVILTTQRTGSTLLCQDIESALRLEYTPTEAFIPLLQGFSKRAIAPNDIGVKLERILQSCSGRDFSVFKIMIDYAGWLGFLCADKNAALSLSYAQLSALFVDRLKCIDQFSLRRLVRLDRKNKLKQAVSRLINAMGLPTHIQTEDDAINFENQLKRKLFQHPNYHCMIVDQLGIILRQSCLLDECLLCLNDTELYSCYEFEADLLNKQDCYLSSLVDGSEFRISKIQRKLKPTSGQISREMLRKLRQVVGSNDL